MKDLAKYLGASAVWLTFLFAVGRETFTTQTSVWLYFLLVGVTLLWFFLWADRK